MKQTSVDNIHVNVFYYSMSLPNIAQNYHHPYSCSPFPLPVYRKSFIIIVLTKDDDDDDDEKGINF